MNIPKPEYERTPFSNLDKHDWNVVISRFNRGIDWCVRKTGSKWAIVESFGKSWPLYKTKTAAFEALDKAIHAESILRSYLRSWY